MPEYNNSYKIIFSYPERTRELLRGFIREDWVDKLDMDSLERVSGSYVSDDLRDRHDDIVWRVRFEDQWLYLYLLIEFQSRVDKMMSLRILTYVGLLYQDLVKGKQLTENGKLPPVLPIVLYNGKPRWTAPLEISELIDDIPGNLAEFSPKLKYFLIDEGSYEPEELEVLKNVVAYLFQLEHASSIEVAGQLIVKITKELSHAQAQQREFLEIFNRWFWKGKINIDEIYRNIHDPREVADMVDRNRDRWYETLRKEGEARGKAEGEARGKAEGEAEGRVRIAKRMLRAGMSVSQVAELTELSEEEVQKLRDSVAH